MSQPQKLPQPQTDSLQIKLGAPRPVKQATLQAETFWPGKIGADLSINPQKYPKLKMLWIPNDGLLLQWEDGSIYTIPAANVKGMEH